jgi:hypothetical protein
MVVQRPSRAKLKAEKGMNLPGANVVVAALTVMLARGDLAI